MKSIVSEHDDRSHSTGVMLSACELLRYEIIQKTELKTIMKKMGQSDLITSNEYFAIIFLYNRTACEKRPKIFRGTLLNKYWQ